MLRFPEDKVPQDQDESSTTRGGPTILNAECSANLFNYLLSVRALPKLHEPDNLRTFVLCPLSGTQGRSLPKHRNERS